MISNGLSFLNWFPKLVKWLPLEFFFFFWLSILISLDDHKYGMVLHDWFWAHVEDKGVVFLVPTRRADLTASCCMSFPCDINTPFSLSDFYLHLSTVGPLLPTILALNSWSSYPESRVCFIHHPAGQSSAQYYALTAMVTISFFMIIDCLVSWVF